MVFYLPLLLYVAPVLVTLLGGRSAWIWGALFLAAVGGFGLAALSSFNMLDGGSGWPIGPLLANERDPAGVAHTFYFAKIREITLTIAVCVVPAIMLCLPGHPRRSRWDALLFWLFAAFALANISGVAFYLGNGGMPHSYVDFDATMVRATAAQEIAGQAAFVTLAIATLRPILLWIKRRIARHAL